MSSTVQAFSAPAQRADSGVAANDGPHNGRQASCASSRPSLDAASSSEAAADAATMALGALQSTGGRNERPVISTRAALAPPATEIMHRTGGGSGGGGGGGGPAVAQRYITGITAPVPAGSSGHPAADAAAAAAEPGTGAGVATARRRPAVHFAPGDTVRGSIPAVDSATGCRDSDGLEAREALEGTPQGADASASSGRGLPEFPAFPVAGCADMASRTQHLNEDSAEPPSSNLHTTAFGEPRQ